MRQVTSLPLSLRPREKLLKQGVEALTPEELISVILITGTKTHSVSAIANKLAKLLKSRQKITKEDLLHLHIGPTKTCQILAFIELSRRLTTNSPPIITSPADIFAHSFDIINAHKESLLCFYFNARHELLKKEVVALGPLNKASLLPREIFSLIKELPVASIILAHNHPSGDLDPSPQDLLFTKRVKVAGDILGVKLLDHIIVSSQGYKRIKLPTEI